MSLSSDSMAAETSDAAEGYSKMESGWIHGDCITLFFFLPNMSPLLNQGEENKVHHIG